MNKPLAMKKSWYIRSLGFNQCLKVSEILSAELQIDFTKGTSFNKPFHGFRSHYGLGELFFQNGGTEKNIKAS